MKIGRFLALVLTPLAVPACIVEPIGGRGYGGGHEHDRGGWRS
ncbi:MAG TPA: hypothetical protein VFG62_00195 [Rhodopila sp.]|nr:hypothetical protein [Rhodopila sp.]